MGRNSSKNWSFLICLTLILTTFAVFYQVHSFKFVSLDDGEYLYENPNIQSGITLKAIKWAFTTDYAYMYHPLTWLSHILDWQLFGPDAGGHHFTSLVFHIANTLLLFIVLKQMTHRLWPSAFVAFLFALHPLHVESVAWLSERKDVLSTFFWLLTMWAYVRYVNRPGIVRYLLVVVFFALGLMAKPMLITLPFVLLLLDYWPLDRLSPKRGKASSKYSLVYLFIEKVPLFVMALASCIVTFIVQKKGGAISSAEGLDLFVRLANASISYLRYIIKMIWPARLAMFYPHPGRDVSVLYAVISAAVLLAVTIFILRFSKDRRYLVTGWLWYLGTLVPVIGLVQVGSQAWADRYSYITLTGLFIIIAWGLPELLGKWPYRKIMLWVSSLMVLSALAVCTHIQLRYWKDSMTLCQHALEVTENNYKAHLCITGMLLEQGRIEEAIRHNTEAVRIKPGYIETHNDLGVTLYKVGRIDEAIDCYKRALEINPADAEVNANLGIALATEGNFAEAVRHYRIAAETMNTPAVHNNLGYALAHMGKLDEAIAHFNQALQINPACTPARVNLNLFLAEKQKLQNKDAENTKK